MTAEAIEAYEVLAVLRANDTLRRVIKTHNARVLPSLRGSFLPRCLKLQRDNLLLD